MGSTMIGLIGMYVPVIIGLISIWIIRKKNGNKQKIDEVQKHIYERSQSIAWYITLILIYFFMTLAMLDIEMGMSMVLALLLLGHLGSWGISAAVLGINLSREEPFLPSYVTIGILLICISVIVFTILTISTQFWGYLLLSIPFTAGGLIIILLRSKSV